MTSDPFIIRSLHEKGLQQQQERDHTDSLWLAPNPAYNDNDVILEHETVYTDLSNTPAEFLAVRAVGVGGDDTGLLVRNAVFLTHPTR